MSQHRSSIKSIQSASIKSSLNQFSEEINQGWNLNPEEGITDIIINYKTDKIRKMSESQNDDEEPLKSDNISLQEKQQTLQKSQPSDHSNVSPMMLSNCTYQIDQFDNFSLNKVISDRQSRNQDQQCRFFKKTKTEQLPEKMTEAEIRMQKRYWDKLRKDYLKKLQCEQLIQKKVSFIKAKSKINQQSTKKLQRKKVYEIHKNEYYQTKIKKNQSTRSLSLPLIKARIVDLSKKQREVDIDNLAPNKKMLGVFDRCNKARQSGKLMSYKSSSLINCQTKWSKKGEKMQSTQNSECELKIVEEVEHQLRRQGMSFNVCEIKKGLMEHKESQLVRSFPSRNLISNPILKRWGL